MGWREGGREERMKGKERGKDEVRSGGGVREG